MRTPTDAANDALDAIGSPSVLSDIEDGSRVAQICLRAYRRCIPELLRAAPWQFARKQAPLTLLGDSTGLTPNVPTMVIKPWIYEYAYPIDCVKAIFIPYVPNNNPAQNNISIPPVPPVDGLGAGYYAGRQPMPSRYLIARDSNYPASAAESWDEVQGVSLGGRTVVLSNVPNAEMVYTSLVLYPTEWDPLFYSAFVAFLASEIWSAIPDMKAGLAVRAQQIAIAKIKISEARAQAGNEIPSSVDIAVDWLRTRNSGGYNMRSSLGEPYGGLWNQPYESLSFSDSSVF